MPKMPYIKLLKQVKKSVKTIQSNQNSILTIQSQ